MRDRYRKGGIYLKGARRTPSCFCIRPKLWEAADKITKEQGLSLTEAVRRVLLDLHPLVHKESWIPLRDRLKALDLAYAKEYGKRVKKLPWFMTMSKEERKMLKDIQIACGAHWNELRQRSDWNYALGHIIELCMIEITFI